MLFRRGGPRALLPVEPLEADGRRWWLPVIDIAEAHDSASRAREDPEAFGLGRLRELLLGAPER